MPECVTEEEAVMTWVCPVRRYCINETHVAQDGDAAIYTHDICRASECPVWRWVKDDDNPRHLGFCGLGGVPGSAP